MICAPLTLLQVEQERPYLYAIHPRLLEKLYSFALRRVNNWLVIEAAAVQQAPATHPPNYEDILFDSFVTKSFERAFLVEPSAQEFDTAVLYVRPSCFSYPAI